MKDKDRKVTLIPAGVADRVGAAGTLGSAYKMPCDQLRGLAPITRIGMTPNIVMVHPSTPFRTVRQRVDYARMQEVGIPPSPTTRQKFDQFVRAEVARWGRVIKEAGIPQQ